MSISSVVQPFPLEKEYMKKTGITPEDIKQLREWLGTQPHLPGEYITDLDLILAYHCSDRSSTVTKDLIDLHYTLKTHFTGLFKDRFADAKTEKTGHIAAVVPIQTKSPEGYAALYCRLIDTDARNFVFSEALGYALMILDLWQYEEGTWPGFLLLIDLAGLTLGHLAKLDLQSVQQLLYYLQEALLLKLKGLHFLNAPSFMDKLMMILRPFMKKELLEMMQIHQIGATTLEKSLSMKALPKGCGGEYKNLEQCRDDILAKIKANADFFVTSNKKRVVEAKRPGKPKSISDIFGGVEGSFKKLDID